MIAGRGLNIFGLPYTKQNKSEKKSMDVKGRAYSISYIKPIFFFHSKY